MSDILGPTSKFCFQLVKASDGRRTPIFTCTPLELCDILIGGDDVFVVTLFAEENVQNISGDVPLRDIFMDIPVYSSASWISTFAPQLLKEEINNG